MPEQFFGAGADPRDDAFAFERSGGGMAGVVQTVGDMGDAPKWHRLRNAVDYSRRRLLPFRDHRFEAVRQYVGHRYSYDGTADKVPVNLMEMAVNVYCRALAANRPKCLITTPKSQLKIQAMQFELAMNVLLDDIDYGMSMHRCIRDAMFSVGIMKVGLAYGSSVRVQGVHHDVGQPFADPVDLDDWVHDMTARTWDECSFMGNRYRLPTQYVQNSPIFDLNPNHPLGPTYKTNYNEFGGQKIDTLSRGIEGDGDEYMAYTELWDLWLPLENRVATFVADDQGSPVGAPVRVVDWDGPDGGPYHMLTFNEVPNNVMPLSPASLWFDLHDLYNRLYNKLGRQAERQKTLLGVQAAAGDDGDRIVNAEDGEAIRLDNPNNSQEYSFGGPVQENMIFTSYTKDLFSWITGNLDSIAGLGAAHDTFRGDALIAQEASKRLAAMQDRTTKFTQSIYKSLGQYLWYDPLIELPITRRVKGTDQDIPSMWTPEQRKGSFLDYNIRIEPYSGRHRSPSERTQNIMQIMQTLVMPALPLMQQQGVGINWDGLMRTLAKYMDMDELDDILVFENPTPWAQMSQTIQPQTAQAQRPATTHRVNERISRPGTPTPGGNGNALMSMMQAPGGQRQQQSSLPTMGRM